MSLIAALLFSAALLAQPAPICTVGAGSGSWSGNPAELAQIEAVYQREQAEAARVPFPNGAPSPSPWSALVTCR